MTHDSDTAAKALRCASEITHGQVMYTISCALRKIDVVAQP